VSAPATAGERLADPVAWSDVEDGAYAADLATWEELAAANPGPILEIGCGTGRVALHLARRGHEVVAIDVVPELAEELARRAAAAGLDVDARVEDARALDLSRRFALVIAPMQVVHLMRGRAGRVAMLRAVAAHLEPGGSAALAILDEESAPDIWFEAAPGELVPDVREIDGWVYSSQPLSFRPAAGGVELRRVREVVSPDGEHSGADAVFQFADITAAGLEQEAAEGGLEPAARRKVAPTEDHVGSAVVVLRKDLPGQADR
jgi:SAM-dependent methyltransferase